jgi:hypothetical protein
LFDGFLSANDSDTRTGPASHGNSEARVIGSHPIFAFLGRYIHRETEGHQDSKLLGVAETNSPNEMMMRRGESEDRIVGRGGQGSFVKTQHAVFDLVANSGLRGSLGDRPTLCG